jgi:hypothetical protein
VRAALHLSRAAARRSWRIALAVALIVGLLGAVALGALAGARRTASAYGRYQASINASDAFVNVPVPVLNAEQMGGQPLTLASGWPSLLALLKVLGMTRRQVRAITWQTTLTLEIAIGAGVPLGIAAGRWAWGTFAGSLGVNPVTVVPVCCWLLVTPCSY